MYLDNNCIEIFSLILQDTQVCNTDPTLCEKENTFLISVARGLGRVQHTLAAESVSDLKKWWNGLQQHMLDQGRMLVILMMQKLCIQNTFMSFNL